MNFSSKQNQFFPVFLTQKNLNILIIGGEKNALERLNFILNEFSVKEICIVSPKINDEIKTISEEYNFIKLLERETQETDFKNSKFIFVTTSESSEIQKFKNLSENNFGFIHFSDFPEESDFQPGSSVGKGQLQIAFFAEKISPSLTKRIKSAFQEIIPNEMDELLGNFTKIQENSKNEFREKISVINKFTKNISQKKNYTDPFSELENTSKIVKIAQRKANVYLGIIGVLVLVGLFFFTLFEFDLYPDVNFFLIKDHHIFLWMLLVGFLAEIIAGSMGMGYGVICTTILLLLNIPPPIVSASIHSAESFTTAAGSISHFKLKNINFKLVKRLAPFAIIGAIIGALLLTYLGEHFANILKPIISLYTLYLGVNIFIKSTRKSENLNKNRKRSKLPVLGIVGGFIDSFAGGGWGPLVTGSLIKDGRTPRYVIGSSTLTKFLLTITSAVTFIYTIGIHHWNIVLGLLIGGVVTAPFSAMLTAKLPVKKMTIAISILVILMSLISIFKAFLK